MKKKTFSYLAGLVESSQLALSSKKKADVSLSQDSVIGIIIAGKKMYINSADVKEIIQDFEVSNVGNTKNWFEGILNIQGEIYSAINMAKLFEIDNVSARPKYAIALTGHDYSYALLVDDILGITKESFLQKVSEGKYTDVYVVEEGEKVLISPQKLVSSPNFMQASL